MPAEPASAAADDERALRDFSTNSLQRHAIEFGAWMVRASLDRARALGHNGLRPSHARLMVVLSWEGSRTTDIARALDVSKNSIGKLVDELEAMGYVERIPDPRDGRAKIVRYTDRGVALTAVEAAIGRKLDAEIADIIGAEHLADLRSILAQICTRLGLGPSANELGS